MFKELNILPKIFFSLSIFIIGAFAEVDLKPLHAGIALEYGKMQNLTYLKNAGNSEQFTINRTVGWISKEATINERLDVNLALGGLFFQFFPFNKGFDYAKVRNSAVSIGQASAKYTLGDLKDPALAISFGLFPYKYNPDSKNLGEYLFRSTPYPSTTINGSWDLINSSYAKTKGLLLEKDLLEGNWKNDLIVSLSAETYPLNDLNLAYTTSFKFGIVEIGAGVNFNNLLPNSPSLTTPKSPYNSYFTYTDPITKQDTVYYADDTYYSQNKLYFAGEASKKRLAGDLTSADALDAMAAGYGKRATLVDSLNKAEKGYTDSVTAGQRPDTGASLNRSYYTYKGTLLMGRASLNLGSLINEKVDFKLYGEVYVLGWDNYPIFYENRSERMPLMLGMSIPTFGLLNNLNIEMEYWKNRYPIIYVKALVPGMPMIDYGEMSPTIDITKPYTKDDIKWSVSAKKSIGQYMTINAQVANDHTRPIRYDFAPYPYETMLDLKSYYYILQLQVNM